MENSSYRVLQQLIARLYRCYKQSCHTRPTFRKKAEVGLFWKIGAENGPTFLEKAEFSINSSFFQYMGHQRELGAQGNSSFITFKGWLTQAFVKEIISG